MSIRSVFLCCHSVAILLMLLSHGALAQRVTSTNDQLWFSVLGDHRFAEHWSFHTEAHVRQAEMGRTPQQWLLRPAVNFHMNNEVLFTMGYSYYRNYRYGAYPIKAPNWEHNIYQQVQLSWRTGRLLWQHRLRMEERFLAQLAPDQNDLSTFTLQRYNYLSRFRVRLGVTLPLGKHAKVEPGCWFANAYDELFLNFGDGARLDLMNQNRISGMLGYQLSAPTSVQLGYLLQTLQRPGAADGFDLVEMNSTLHVVFTCNLDLRKKTATP